MHVVEIRLQQVLEGGKQYRVPLYQRTYSWSPKQLERLWSDVVELADTRRSEPGMTHFTGSLVLSAGAVGPGGSEFLVVDGQQRLTTLSVLIAAIRDHIETAEPDAGDKVAQLHETFLINRFKQGDARLKLLPTQADRDAFRAIVDGAISGSMKSGVLDAYRFFRTKLIEADDPEDPHDIDLISSAVLDGLAFVSITANHDDNVYRIFESLNNTGMKLTQGDLLRNYIFMRLGPRGEEVYTAVWLPMQTLLSSSDLESLFWMDMTWTVPEAKLNDIYALQEARLSKLPDEAIAPEIYRYARMAELLATIRQPDREADPVIRERLARLQEWGSTAADPLVLRLLGFRESEQADGIEVARALKVLESYLVRRLIVNAPSNGLSRILLRAAGELDPAQLSQSLHRYLSTGRKFFATDRQVGDAVIAKPFYYSGRPAQRKTLLAWLEKLASGKEPASLDAATIEHVMPQTLTPDWRDSLSVDLGEFSSVDDVHEAYLHTLAYLTLSGYNSELSNSPFSTKRELLEASNIALNAPIAKNATWGREQLVARGADLAEMVVSHWVAPLNDTEAVESGIAWSLVKEVVSAIPAGRWTTYGNVAAIAGTHPVPLGVFLGSNPVPNAWRVLQAAGTVSPGFRWPSPSPHTGRDPIEVLTEEGVTFDLNGHAEASQKLDVTALGQLIGVQMSTESEADVEADVSSAREDAFLDQLSNRFTPAAIHGVIETLAFWRSLGGHVGFGTSADIGAFLHMRAPGSGSQIWPFVIYSYGSVEVVFQWLANRAPFNNEAIREEFRARLNQARGIEIPETSLNRRPTFAIAVLADSGQRRRVFDALEWFAEVAGEFDRQSSLPSSPTRSGVIEFTLDGSRRELSQEIVRERLSDEMPGRITTHWVEIEGRQWPVKQALALALGVDQSSFISTDARRHLGALGFTLGSNDSGIAADE